MKRKTSRKASRRKSRRISGDQRLAPAVVSGMRRKKGKRKKSRKIGAMSSGSPVNTLLQVGAGAAVGIIADMIADKFAPSLNPKIKSVAKLGVGVALVVVGKKPVLRNIGIGLAINGGTSTAKDFGVIQATEEFIRGIGEDSDTLRIEMNGTPENAGRIQGEEMSGTNYNSLPPVIG